MDDSDINSASITGDGAIGFMFENGRGGLPKDEERALNWFRKAADAGSSAGMTNLAFMYENGRGGLPMDEA